MYSGSGTAIKGSCAAMGLVLTKARRRRNRNPKMVVAVGVKGRTDGGGEGASSVYFCLGLTDGGLTDWVLVFPHVFTFVVREV